MTTPSVQVVARARGHDAFSLRDGAILLDGPPGELPTVRAPLTPEETAAAEAAIAAEPVPAVVSARQARLALIGAGLLDAVETAVAGLSAAHRVEWEYATEVHRDHALIADLATALDLTSAQVDDLFRAAALL